MSETHPFEAFMKSYQNMVFTTAMRLLGSEAEAQDISQEVFLKAYERFDELSQSPTVGGWLRTVATNLCLNHLSRYRSRWRFFSEYFSSSGDDDGQEIDFPAPETLHGQLDGADRRQMLEKALQKLPSSQRVPLVLYHFENLRYEEISEKLNISLSKVKTDIFRGRETLRRKLQLDSSGGQELDEFKAKDKPRRSGDSRPDTFRSARNLLLPNAAST